MPPPPGPPVAQELDCQTSSSPSLLAPTLTRANADGRAAGDFEFGAAFEHHLYRRATGLLGKLRGDDAPAIGTELAAESAADVLLPHVNVGRGHAERLRHLAGHSGDVLRRDLHFDVIVCAPGGDSTVRFEAAVRDDRNAVETFTTAAACLNAAAGSPCVFAACFL